MGHSLQNGLYRLQKGSYHSNFLLHNQNVATTKLAYMPRASVIWKSSGTLFIFCEGTSSKMIDTQLAFSTFAHTPPVPALAAVDVVAKKAAPINGFLSLVNLDFGID
jgi:hypothetical protein